MNVPNRLNRRISTTENVLGQAFDEGVMTGLKIALQEIEQDIEALNNSKDTINVMIKRIENERKKANELQKSG